MELLESLVTSPTGIIVATVITLYAVYYWFYHTRPHGFPPGPISLPIIAGLHARGLDSERIPWRFKDLADKYGPIFSMQSPTKRWGVILSDLELIKEAFVKRGNDFSGRPFDAHYPTVQKLINPLFPKAGIVFSDYDEQVKLQRNVSMVVLRSLGYGKKSIENIVSIETGYLITAMKSYEGKSFNAKHLIDNAVANIIVSLMFGERYEYSDEEFRDLQNTLDIFFEYFIKLSIYDLIWFAKYIPIVKKWIKTMEGATGKLNDWAQSKMDEKLAEQGSGENNFISLYLKEVEKDRENGGILDNRSLQLIKDFFGAGAETTATTIGWAIYFMIKYPKVQEKVREEINTVIGEGCRAQLKDRDRLPYTEATISEILRVACTAPFSLPHSTTVDTEVGGYKIPKGTEVIANLFAVLHNPNVFPEPDILKPERFLDERGDFVKHEHLIAFSAGRRSCLGEQLARQELFLFFTHLIQSFEFKLPSGDTLPPQRGLWAMTYRPPPFNISAISLD